MVLTRRTPIATNSTLATVASGKTVKIQNIQFNDEFCKRCFALGLRIGADVTVIRKASFNGPIHISLGTTDLVLRVDLASQIVVTQS